MVVRNFCYIFDEQFVKPVVPSLYRNVYIAFAKNIDDFSSIDWLNLSQSFLLYFIWFLFIAYILFVFWLSELLLNLVTVE